MGESFSKIPRLGSRSCNVTDLVSIDWAVEGYIEIFQSGDRRVDSQSWDFQSWKFPGRRNYSPPGTGARRPHNIHSHDPSLRPDAPQPGRRPRSACTRDHVGRRIGLGRQVETFADMSKSRTMGFLDYQPTYTCFTDLFDELRANRIIPPL
jgi:hypothetical protein